MRAVAAAAPAAMAMWVAAAAATAAALGSTHHRSPRHSQHRSTRSSGQTPNQLRCCTCCSSCSCPRLHTSGRCRSCMDSACPCTARTETPFSARGCNPPQKQPSGLGALRNTLVNRLVQFVILFGNSMHVTAPRALPDASRERSSSCTGRDSFLVEDVSALCIVAASCAYTHHTARTFVLRTLSHSTSLYRSLSLSRIGPRYWRPDCTVRFSTLYISVKAKPGITVSSGAPRATHKHANVGTHHVHPTHGGLTAGVAARRAAPSGWPASGGVLQAHTRR